MATKIFFLHKVINFLNRHQVFVKSFNHIKTLIDWFKVRNVYMWVFENVAKFSGTQIEADSMYMYWKSAGDFIYAR